MAPKAVKLTKAAFKAIRREAHRDLENSIQERELFMRDPEKADDARRYEKRLLAVADVLGALFWREGKFGNEPTVEVEFSSEAIDWMRDSLLATTEHVKELDTTGEGGFDYRAKEAYVAHVLEYVVLHATGNEP